MARGSPANQHELMVTGLVRCLQQAYPTAEFSFGTVISGLGLKPDIFVSHPDGRRWAYEIIHKNADVARIQAKQQQYEHSGVSIYWILWETLAPGKPLDSEKVATQSIWVTDQFVEQPRRYRLTKLQRTLAQLGAGNLYVFSLYKPLLDQVEHWLLKLIMIGLDIYYFAPEQLEKDWVQGDWEMAPLPYLTFNEQGQPQLKPDATDISSIVSSTFGSVIEMPTDRPVLIKEPLANLDGLLQSPGKFQELLTEAFKQAIVYKLSNFSQPEIEQLAQELQTFKEQMPAIQPDVSSVTTAEAALQKLGEYISNLPGPIQEAFREILPLPTEQVLRQVFEIKQWFEEDAHLQALLADEF